MKISVEEKFEKIAKSLNIDYHLHGWKASLSRKLGFTSDNIVSVYINKDYFPEKSIVNRLAKCGYSLSKILHTDNSDKKMLFSSVLIKKINTTNKPVFKEISLTEEDYNRFLQFIKDYISQNSISDFLDYIEIPSIQRDNLSVNHILSIFIQDMLWAYNIPIQLFISSIHNKNEKPKNIPSKNKDIGNPYEDFRSRFLLLQEEGRLLGFDISLNFLSKN